EGGIAGGPGEDVRGQRGVGRGRPGGAGVRRPRLVHAVPARPPPDGRARVSNLRGDGRDPQAEGGGGSAGRQGVGGIQVSVASEIEILNRPFRAKAASLSPEAARSLLALKFTRADREKMRRLAEKARGGRSLRRSERKQRATSAPATSWPC